MARFTAVGVDAQVKNFGDFQRKLGKMDRSIGALGRAGSIAATGIKLIGAAVLTGAAAITGIGIASVKSTASIEDAFIGVLKTTEGLGDGLFTLSAAGEEVFQQFRDITLETPHTFEELAEIGEIAGMMGIAETAIADFSLVAAQMGIATDLSGRQAAMGLSAFMEQTGAADKEARNIADAVVYLGNNFAVFESQILAMTPRIGFLTNIIDISKESLLGYAAASGVMKFRTESASTAFVRAMLKMDNASHTLEGGVIDNTAAMEENQSELDHLQQELAIATQRQSEYTESTKESTKMQNALRIEDLTEQVAIYTEHMGDLDAMQGKTFVGGSEDLETFARVADMSKESFVDLFNTDPMEAYIEFLKGLKDNSKESDQALSDLGLASARYEMVTLGMAANVGLLERAVDGATDAFAGGNDLAEEAEKRYGTFNSMLQIVKNQIRDLGTTIGLNLLPVISSWFQSMKPLIKEFGEKLPGLMKDHVMPAFMKFSAFVTDKLIPGISKLATWLITDLPIGIQKVSNWWTKFTGKMTTSAKSLKTKLQPVFEKLTKFWNETLLPTLKSLATIFKEQILPTVKTVVQYWSNQLKPVFETVTEAITVNLGKLSAFIQRNMPAIKETIQTVITAIVNFYTKWAPQMRSFFHGISLAITSFITGLRVAIEGIITFITSVVRGKWHMAWKGLQTALGGVVAGILGILAGLGEMAWSALEMTWDILKNIGTAVIEIIRAAVRDINHKAGEIWRSFWDSLVDFIFDLADNIATAVEGFVSKIPYHLSNFVDFLWNDVVIGIELALRGIADKFFELLGNVSGILIDLANEGGRRAKEFFDNIKAGFEERREAAKKAIESWVSGVEKTVTDWVADRKADGQNLVDNIKAGFEERREAAKKAIEDWVSEAEKTITDWVDDRLQSGRDLIDNIKAGFEEKREAAKKAIEDWVSETEATITGWAADRLEDGRQLVKNLMAGIQEYWDAFLTTPFGAKLLGWATTISDWAADRIEDGKAIIQNLIDGVTETWDEIVQASWEERLQMLIDAITNLFTGTGNAIDDAVDGVLQAITDFIDTNWQTIVELPWVTTLSSIPARIVGLGQAVYDAAKGILQKLLDGLRDKWEEIKDEVGEIFGKITGFFGSSEPKNPRSPLRHLEKRGEWVINQILSGMKKAWPALEAWTNAVFGKFADDLEGLLGFGGGVGQFAGSIADRFTETTLDPLEAAMEQQADSIKALREESESNLEQQLGIQDQLREELGTDAEWIADFMNAGMKQYLALSSIEQKRFKELLQLEEKFGTFMTDRDKDELKRLRERISVTEAFTWEQWLLADDMVDLQSDRADILKEIAELEANSAMTAEQYRMEQERILELQKAQADLDFLQQQFEFLKMIREEGLDVSTILGGLKLGLDADLPALIEAMTEAIRQIVNKVNEELKIASPSGVFKTIGQNIMQGLIAGVEGMSGRAQAAVLGNAVYAPTVMAPAVQGAAALNGGNTQNININAEINNGMDMANFEQRVLRIVRSDM